MPVTMGSHRIPLVRFYPCIRDTKDTRHQEDRHYNTEKSHTISATVHLGRDRDQT